MAITQEHVDIKTIEYTTSRSHLNNYFLCALKYEPYNNLKSSKPEAHSSSVLLRKIIIKKRVI